MNDVTIVPERRRTKAEIDLGTAFADRSGDLPGEFAPRAAAFARFEAKGLPHRRIEPYHFTDLRTLLTAAPLPAERPSGKVAVPADVFAGLEAARAVFVDGWFAADLSDLTGLGEGVTVTTIAEGLAKGDGALVELGRRVSAEREADADPMVALASAFYTDGLVVRVAAGAEAARPLAIRHVSRGKSVSAFVRHAVAVGEGASLTVIESHESPDGVEIHAHALVELTVGAGAEVIWVDHQREGDAAVRLATLVVDVADGGKVDHSLVTLGAKLARTQIFARLGANVDFATRGATLAKGRAHADATLAVTHAAPNSVSRELYKAAVDDEAKSVFQGRIAVEKAAQGTDGRMGAHAVLLSDRAEAAAKPELEIFADDVACAHGATVADLSDDLKFYLMSRGIPAAETEKLLIRAFLGEVTDAIGPEVVREAIEGELEAWIDARGGKAA